MNERHDITLREAEGPNPPNLLEEIVREIKNLVPSGADAAGSYIKGKGQQQLARAQEIQSKVYEKIGQLEIERQRLIQERDDAIHKDDIQQGRDRMEHKEHMYALKTERFEVVVACLEYLQDIGVTVEPEVIKKALSDLVKGDEVIDTI